MAFLKKLVEESAQVAENIRDWVPAIDAAVQARGRAADILAKGSFATPPPGRPAWWGGTAGDPVLVNPAGQPVSSGSSGGSGRGGSSPPARIGRPSWWAGREAVEEAAPNVDEMIAGQRARPYWVLTRNGLVLFDPSAGRSGRGSGGGGGGGYADARDQLNGPYSAARLDTTRDYVQGGTGTVVAQGSGKSVTAGETIIATEIRNLRNDIRALNRGDGGAQLRRDQII